MQNCVYFSVQKKKNTCSSIRTFYSSISHAQFKFDKNMYNLLLDLDSFKIPIRVASLTR